MKSLEKEKKKCLMIITETKGITDGIDVMIRYYNVCFLTHRLLSKLTLGYQNKKKSLVLSAICFISIFFESF